MCQPRQTTVSCLTFRNCRQRSWNARPWLTSARHPTRDRIQQFRRAFIRRIASKFVCMRRNNIPNPIRESVLWFTQGHHHGLAPRFNRIEQRAQARKCVFWQVRKPLWYHLDTALLPQHRDHKRPVIHNDTRGKPMRPDFHCVIQELPWPIVAFRSVFRFGPKYGWRSIGPKHNMSWCVAPASQKDPVCVSTPLGQNQLRKCSFRSGTQTQQPLFGHRWRIKHDPCRRNARRQCQRGQA